MSAAKLLNLLALSSLAVLLCSQGVVPANALSAEHNVGARHAFGGHDQIVKKRRSALNKRQCRTRSNTATSETPSATSSAAEEPSSTDFSGAALAAVTSSAAPDSTSSAPATSTPITSSGSGKVGFCWGGSNDELANFVTGKTKYFYNWSAVIPDSVRSLGLSPMIQLWGYKNVDEFEQNAVQGYADWILGMNEPNESGQSNMSPEEAVALWQQHIQPKKDLGYKLVSPATSGNPAGKEWMQKFYDQCSGCTFDAQAVHWYDIDADNFIDYVTDYHDRFGHPVFVTEFADQNFNGGAQASMDEIWAFKAAVTPFLESNDWILGYFPFGFMHDMVNVNYDNQLMGGDGKPTALGASYIN
ncbi:glycosyl hydrolase catalytic core-domain-containing protein [Schizophyllum amplum]|uniref:Glycosyl hydrolase catalytic core-domain-containing protein n=1 Tax=Schizophyllum amplum TaxID=97359 RepID=A0A550CU18_9AGAR|nr:glycosyl hydrolase catalytic core-domain-containing protein [Auriculariopsis ampla]